MFIIATILGLKKEFDFIDSENWSEPDTESNFLWVFIPNRCVLSTCHLKTSPLTTDYFIEFQIKIRRNS